MSAYRYKPDWNALRLRVCFRDQGQCVACGDDLAEWECHHRRLRAQGGPDSPENLVSLCFECHEQAHRDRAWARAQGLILHRGDPFTTPAMGWLLAADGTREAVG